MIPHSFLGRCYHAGPPLVQWAKEHRSFSTKSVVVSPDEEYLTVKTASSLQLSDVTALLRHQIFALRVPNYTSPDICSSLSEKLLRGRVQEYSNAPGIGRVGIAYYEVMNSEERQNYYRDALPNMQSLRELCHPYLSPIDKFRLELQDLWSKGAHLQNLGYGNMFAGLSRAIEADKDILPHEDVLRRDYNSGKEGRNILAQVAMNVYLQLPKIGGELELWNRSCSDEEFDRLRGDFYGIQRAKLPAANLSIKPLIGELVLFHSTRLHAVKPVKGDSRVSISCFFAYRGDHRPLTIWS